MSKYLSGYEVMQELEIEGFELVQYAKKGTIQPYTKHGRRICDFRKKEELESQDGHRLYLKMLELGSLNTDKVIRSGGINFGTESKRAQLEAEIKEMEDNGVNPIAWDQVLPSDYKDCVWEKFDLPMDERKAEKIIARFQEFLFLKADVEKIKLSYKEIDDNSNQSNDNFLPISWDRNLNWSDITVKFLNEHEVHIQFLENGKAVGITRRFDQVGFGDGRKGYDVPVISWQLFVLASKKGNIPHSFENRHSSESKVKELRKKLRAMFPNIKGDPIRHVKKDEEYQFEFHVVPAE